MSTVGALFVLVAAAAITYAARAGMILLLADRRIPPPVERALDNVGPAVLSALAMSLAVGTDGVGALTLAEGVALVVAGGVAVTTRNLMWTFGAGMAALLVLDAVT